MDFLLLHSFAPALEYFFKSLLVGQLFEKTVGIFQFFFMLGTYVDVIERIIERFILKFLQLFDLPKAYILQQGNELRLFFQQ